MTRTAPDRAAYAALCNKNVLYSERVCMVVVSESSREWLTNGKWFSTRQAGALVIGGDHRALGVVRSLGRKGIPVWVLRDHHFVAGLSRYAKRHLRWPAGDGDRLQYLLNLCEKHKLHGWALFPTDDETVALIARNHSVLRKRFRLTTPPWEVLRLAYDKRLTHRLAVKNGVDQPQTYLPKNQQEIAALECRFPVILKLAFTQGANDSTDSKAWRAGDREALLSSYDEACALADPEVIMIQEWIPGGSEEQFSFAALCVDGDPLAWITARRTRQYATDHGLESSYVESADVPEIEALARPLLKALSSTGLVEVEFKRDPRDGRYKLLDINSRVWDWHTLGSQAGTDFPHLLWRVIHGERIPETRGLAGARWVRMVPDLPAVLKEIFQGRLAPRTYLRTLRGPLEFAVFAFDDPIPALVDAPYLAWQAWKWRAKAKPFSGVADERPQGEFIFPTAGVAGIPPAIGANNAVAGRQKFQTARNSPGKSGSFKRDATMVCSVCVATYKRPQTLDGLLRSLVQQALPKDVVLEVIVVDNDPERSAESLVRQYENTREITFQYFSQPIKNISLTRNVAVQNTTGTHILFIDDDEVACPDWVARLLKALKEYDADGVFGPSVPFFDNTAPEWIRKGVRLFVDTIPVTPTGTEAGLTWTCNCLVKASLLRGIEGPFDPAYGLTGGEDGDLFERLKRRGARFIYCNEAPAFEYWPSGRTRVSYLVRRSLMGGSFHTRMTIAASRRKMRVRLFLLLKAIFFGLTSLALVVIAFPSKVWRTYWEMKVASNTGRFLAVFGRYYQAYK